MMYLNIPKQIHQPHTIEDDFSIILWRAWTSNRDIVRSRVMSPALNSSGLNQDLSYKLNFIIRQRKTDPCFKKEQDSSLMQRMLNV